MRGLPVVLGLVAGVFAHLDAVGQEPARREMETSLTFVARISDISGDVDSDLGLDYGDLWGTGFGLGIESNFMAPLKKGWSIGGYFSAGFDLFQGGDEAEDDFGDTLEADDLYVSHLFVGFKAMLAPERGFFFDGRLGFGAAFWGAVDGELTIGGISGDVAVFDSSVAFAFEFGSHVGYATRNVFFGGGFSVRSMGEPDEADLDFEGISAALVASFELDVGLRF